jgi:putative molybdopterin biosynthesis protein
LAVIIVKPISIVPGFPTSAIFTFHEFVAPVIRAFAGLSAERTESLPATLPLRVSSERGRTEYLMVSLVRGGEEGALAAYPNAKGSGAVTAFSQADGFISIGQHVESVPAGTPVEVQLIGRAHLADLVIIGSHCVGLDILIDRLQADGCSVKSLNVGSTGGLAAAKRGECDVAPVHLMDPETGEYNRPFLTPALELVPGYRRLQGIVYRVGDRRFEGRSFEEIIAIATDSPECLMVNRNAGSGTRILTDRLLKGAKPPGYWSQPKSHNAVAVAVAQQRADWGMAIESVARQYGLGFVPVQDEHYDFIVPKARLERLPVQRFKALLEETSVRDALVALGFGICPNRSTYLAIRIATPDRSVAHSRWMSYGRLCCSTVFTIPLWQVGNGPLPTLSLWSRSGTPDRCKRTTGECNDAKRQFNLITITPNRVCRLSLSTISELYPLNSMLVILIRSSLSACPIVQPAVLSPLGRCR